LSRKSYTYQSMIISVKSQVTRTPPYFRFCSKSASVVTSRGRGQTSPSSPLKDHPDGSLEGVGPPGEPQDIRPPIYDLQLKKRTLCIPHAHTDHYINAHTHTHIDPSPNLIAFPVMTQFTHTQRSLKMPISTPLYAKHCGHNITISQHTLMSMTDSRYGSVQWSIKGKGGEESKVWTAQLSLKGRRARYGQLSSET
jgi:hypothetical protein